ncbi:MAG: Fic family protein [Elusimicrobia bacterium]|nr:Fic family protein [Elusimicrobiota bacterium]
MKRDELTPRLRAPYDPKRDCGVAKTPEPGYENIWFVVPPPPPRTPPAKLPLKALARAAEILARQKEFAALDGVDKLIGYYFVRREAVESSRLEGTWSTIDHVLTPGELRDAGADEGARRSVRGYARTLETQLSRAAQKTEAVFTLKTVLDIHRGIMAKDPRFRGTPGALRAPGGIGAVVQIGGSYRKEEATYNPAPPRFVASSLKAVLDWLSDKELAQRGDAGVSGFTLPVRLAVAHAHFEAVHPFSDGNGRVGRALWPLQMACAGRMPLYLSGFVETYRDDYGRALQSAQKRLAYAPLVEFVCEAILRSDAEAAVSRAAIEGLPARWRERARFRGGSTALRALELLQRMPIVTIAVVVDELGVTKQAARRALEQLVERGVVRNRGRAGRTQLFAAEELISLLSRPFGSDAEAALRKGRALIKRP